MEDSMSLQVDFYSLFGGVNQIRQPGAGSLKVLEDEEVEPEINYLNREDVITSLIRKKQTKKLYVSRLNDIFSAKALKKEGTILMVNTLTEYMRKKLIECIVTKENGFKEFHMTDELRELLGDDDTNEALTYFKGLKFFQFGSQIAAHFVTKKYMEISGYSFSPENKDKWSDDCIMAFSVGQLSPSKRGKKYYIKGDSKTNTLINDAALLLARAVMYAEVKKVFDEDEEFRKYIYDRINIPEWFYEEGKSVNTLICDSDLVENICRTIGIHYRRIEEPVVGNKIGNTYVATQSSSVVKNELLFPAALKGLLIENGYFINGFNGKFIPTYFERNLIDAYQYILRRDEAMKMMHKYEKKSKGDYALSFQTKKNIPGKIIDRMKSSKFNDSFGYVEFDEDCDISKIAEIEYEWSAMCEKIFGCNKYPDVSLRFRRLGNHKASGLYYSGFRCICIDIRTPSSMVHEFMHMIDDGTLTGIRGDYLSLKNDFERILSYYSGLIDKANIKCTGKYDKNYYKTPTEVFARCSEMYVSRVLKVKNSLITEEHGFAYPDDPKLMEYITSYFDTLFSTAFTYERQVAV